jgi:uncharacterized membrane protein (UPF0182 family)
VISFGAYLDIHSHHSPVSVAFMAVGIIIGAIAALVVTAYTIDWLCVDSDVIAIFILGFMLFGFMMLGAAFPLLVGFFVMAWNEKYRVAEKVLSEDGDVVRSQEWLNEKRRLGL